MLVEITVKEMLLLCLLKNAVEMLFLAECFSSEGGWEQLGRHTDSRGVNFPFVSDGCRLFFFSPTLFSHVSTLFEVKCISAFLI